MNPDVLITIVFVGIVVSIVLAALFLVLPSQRRESALVNERELRRQAKDGSGPLSRTNPSSTAESERSAAVH